MNCKCDNVRHMDGCSIETHSNEYGDSDYCQWCNRGCQARK